MHSNEEEFRLSGAPRKSRPSKPNLSELEQPLTEKAKSKVVTIAAALADVLSVDDRTIAGIRNSPHLAAVETADIFARVLKDRGRLRQTTPITDAAVDPGASQTGDQWFRDAAGFLVVGHQPRLTRLARVFTRSHLPANSLPLGSTEFAAIRLEGHPALLWLLTEKDTELKSDLRQRIQFKFEVANFFSRGNGHQRIRALSSTLAGLLDSSMRNPPGKVLVVAGAAALVVAIALSIATLLAFDRLTMSTEFWSEPSARRSGPPSGSVARPPSETTVVLFFEMIHVWITLFEPALFSAVIAMACFFLAICATKLGLGAAATLVSPLCVTACAIGVAVYYAKVAPRLGFED